MPGCHMDDRGDVMPDQMKGAIESGFPRKHGYRIASRLVDQQIDPGADRPDRGISSFPGRRGKYDRDIAGGKHRRIIVLQPVGVVFAQVGLPAHQDIPHAVRQVVVFRRFRGKGIPEKNRPADRRVIELRHDAGRDRTLAFPARDDAAVLQHVQDSPSRARRNMVRPRKFVPTVELFSDLKFSGANPSGSFCTPS